MISERPAEVEDRAVPGHWEGDLVMAKASRRSGPWSSGHSRYVMLFPSPDGNTADLTRTALEATIKRLPEHLWRSLTWDQGNEMAGHARFTVDTGIQIYFCGPGHRRSAARTRTPRGCSAAIDVAVELDGRLCRHGERPCGARP